MTTGLAGEVFLSGVPDIGDVPLSEDVGITGLEYARIMRRIGLADGDQSTPVSAFNSSI